MEDPYGKSTVIGGEDPFDSVDDQHDAPATPEGEQRAAADSYYAILNVPSTASDDDIKNAYKRLCLTFHPDKHTDADSKLAAQPKFEKIQKAYDVLSNPTKRHIYDTYGAEAADMQWDLGVRGKTREEVREEYERMKRQQRLMEEEGTMKSRGEIQLNLDASQIFDSDVRLGRFRQPQSRGLADILQLPDVTQAFVRHSWETQLTGQTSFILDGNVRARNGIGVGVVAGTVRHIISPTSWGEISTTVGQGKSFEAKYVQNFTPACFGTLQANTSTLDCPPHLTAVIGRRLTKRTTGYLTYRTGSYTLGSWGADYENDEKSTCSLGLMHRTTSGQLNVDVSAGLSHSLVSVSYFHKFPRTIRARASVSLSTSMGITTTLATDKRITKHARLGLGVDLGTLTGVTFRVKLARLGQKLSLPITLTPQFNPTLAFYSLLVPLSSIYVLDRFVLLPRRKRLQREKLEEVRQQNKEVLEQRRKEAEEAVRLMGDAVKRKTEQEKERGGLIIVKAIYGRLDKPKGLFYAEGEDRGQDEVIDVTTVVQSLVTGGQLHISGGYSKSGILGFYDPCFGLPKRLRITYRYGGKLHVVEVGDLEAVAAPLRAHTVGDVE
ncbi:hypothetical protein BC832DRAFT_582641 [Gaertneriomyces semiglobifer]|nr:hypothetical protein BC832DRAFT_582641 [Gaertneriomyces semiglobifer]